MARPKVRIGFVGAGSMGQMAHLQHYTTIEDCQVVALAELRQKTGRQIARRYNVPNYYPEASAMLAREELDAIVAIQPFTRHGLILNEVLKRGKPVLIEKPLASSIQIGEDIVERMQQNSTFIMVGYHKRSDPATMYAKGEIERLKQSGEIGCLQYVRITIPPGDWVANGFRGMIDEHDNAPELEHDPKPDDVDEKQHQEYTRFVNYYIHQVNLLRHLLGEPYQPVFADKSGVLFVGESASGVTCTLEMTPYATTRAWQEQALVCFERGWVQLDLPAPLTCNRAGNVTIYRDPGDSATPISSSPTLPCVAAMQQQALNFVAAVRGRPPMTGAQEALEDLRVARQYLRLHLGH